MKELTTRGYLDSTDDTVDCLLMFIPNEQVYGFVQENDRSILDDAMRHKIVVCSPLTLYAVLAVVRQAVDNFQLERTSSEILGLLGEFSRQWEKYSAQLEKVQQRFEQVAEGVLGADDHPSPRAAAPARQDRAPAPRGARPPRRRRSPPLTFPELSAARSAPRHRRRGSVAFAAVTQVTVLGGGQLGRMLGLAGVPLGLAFRFLDPSSEAPAAAVGELVVGGLDDRRGARPRPQPARRSSPTSGKACPPRPRALEVGRRPVVRPSPRALEVSQDRLVEKEHVPVARHRDRAVPRGRRSRRRSTPRSPSSGSRRC